MKKPSQFPSTTLQGKRIPLNANPILAVVLVSLVMLFATAQGIAGETPLGSQTTVLQVNNLSCGSCLFSIKNELNKYDGMIAMESDLARGLIKVDQRAPLHKTQIALIVSDLGYPATVVPAKLYASGQGGPTAPGYACIGCPQTDGVPCGASASTWQKLYQRFFGSKNTAQQR